MYKNPYIKLNSLTKRPYTEILLIRHCHPNYRLAKKMGDKEMPLSKDGLKQRKYLTARLLKSKIDVVYSSELKRAINSAESFIKKTKKKLIINSRLNELHWSHWYKIKYFNMTEKEREKRLVKHKILDKELDKMQATARRAIAEIFRENKGKKIAIFGHGNFIKSLISGILNADIIGFLSLEIFQSSISKLIVDRDGYIKIIYLNNINHLPESPFKDVFLTLFDYEKK